MSGEEYPVAYIMSRFPGLSETFILREMCEMESLGRHLELYPLILQNEDVVHDEALEWIKRAQYPTFLQLVLANLILMFFHPIRYYSVFAAVVFGNSSSLKFLIRAIFVFPLAVWMARQMAGKKIKHIHVHYATHPALAAWVIHQLTSIPYGVTVHAHDIFVDQSMLRRKLLDAKYIISISEYNRTFLADLYGDWILKKTQIVHCGIEPNLYSRGKGPDEPQERFEVISIGSLRPYKGFTYLLDACDILKRDGVSFRCRIIGGGELLASLSRKVQDLHISDVVEFVGPKSQKEVTRYLQTSNCYVQPSIITSSGKMEGIPVSLMEAMACDVPVIATNISGIPELVLHETTGWLVPPESPLEIANAIKYVIMNPEKTKNCAKNARMHVIMEYNILQSVKRLSKIIYLSNEDNLWK